MQVTRLTDAPAYFPPEHHDMRCLRLQGMEAGETSSLWMGMSQILPGGRTSLSASPQEKLYIVLEGAVTVVTDQGEAVLQRHDSCRIAPHEARALENRTNLPALILLAMPLLPAK